MRSGHGRPLSGTRPRSGMRTAHGSTDQSAYAAEQDRRNDSRMWVSVALGSKGRSHAKADEGSNQSMAPVAWLTPRRSMPRTAGISDSGWNRGHRSMLRNP